MEALTERIKASVLNDIAKGYEETTPEEVLAAMEKKYPDTPRDEIGHAIADILNQLLREGLLKD